MPEISRFYGIIIKMLYSDDDKHSKPHVHVYYGEYEAWNHAVRNQTFDKIAPLK